MSERGPDPGVPPLEASRVESVLGSTREDREALLSGSEFDTDLGLAMAEDGQRVSRGDLTSQQFWSKYDEPAVREFGGAYTRTPNPAIDATDGSQTLDDDLARSLSCATGPMGSVADGIDGGREETAVGEETPRYGMVIDFQKCVGCDSCTVACKAENRTPPGVSYNEVFVIEEGDTPATRRVNLPRPCMQCEFPSCVQVCPVSATYKMDDGIVTIDYDRCIGCRHCVSACPYGARFFDFGEFYDAEVLGAGTLTSPEYGIDRGEREEGEPPIGSVRKCSFCYHRIHRGEEPACVETCIGDARNFGDLGDPESDVSKMANSSRAFQLLPESGNDPNVDYLS